MQEYVIIADSCCDLGEETIRSKGLDIIYLSVNIDGKEYDGNINKISEKELYQLMRKGEVLVTSQRNPSEVEKVFERYLRQGKDIIMICLDSKLSGMCISCEIAKENILSRYKERKIEVIDSLSGSLGEGLLVLEGIKAKEQGKTFEEVINHLKLQREKICHIFTVNDIGYLYKGSGASKGKEILDTLFNIKPILSADKEGNIIQIARIRGKSNAMKYMLERMEEVIEVDDKTVVAIGHGDCENEAKEMEEMIKIRYNVKNFIIRNIGVVVGAHSGPGALAVFFLGKGRIED